MAIKGGKEDKKEGGYTRIERSKRRYEAKEKKTIMMKLK